MSAKIFTSIIDNIFFFHNGILEYIQIMDFSSNNFLMPIVNRQSISINLQWIQSKEFPLKAEIKMQENRQRKMKLALERQKQREMIIKKRKNKQQNVQRLLQSKLQARKAAKEVVENYRRVCNTSMFTKKQQSLFPRLPHQSPSEINITPLQSKPSLIKSIKSEQGLKDSKILQKNGKNQKLIRYKSYQQKEVPKTPVRKDANFLRETIIDGLKKQTEQSRSKLLKKKTLEENPVYKQMTCIEFGLQSTHQNYSQLLKKLQHMISSISTTDKPQQDEQLLLILQNELSTDTANF